MILNDLQNLISRIFIIEFVLNATMNEKQHFAHVINISNIK